MVTSNKKSDIWAEADGEIDLKSLVAILREQNAVLSRENTVIKQRLEVIESKLAKQEELQKKTEVDKTKCSVIIKGLPLHKDAKDGIETRKQAQETMKSFVSALDLGTELGFTEAVRFKGNEEGKVGLMKLTVSTTKQKGKIYEGLAKASKKGALKKINPKISVTDEIPAFLRSKKIELEKQAYEIRKADKNMKTRVFIQGIDLVLKQKGKKDLNFVEVGKIESENIEEDKSGKNQIEEELDEEEFPLPEKAGKKTPKKTTSSARGRGAKRGTIKS